MSFYTHPSLLLASRFLKPKKTFLSVITAISVLGVTLGIMVLIIVISVMTGFERELQHKILGFDAHITVQSVSGVLSNWEPLLTKISTTPGVVAASPYVQGPVIAEFDHRRLTQTIRGIETDPTSNSEAPNSDLAVLKKYLKKGKVDLEGDSALVGSELAHSLGVEVGDALTIYSPGNRETMEQQLDQLESIGKEKNTHAQDAKKELQELILPRDVTVTGVFESGRYQYDSQVIILPLYLAQELYGLGDDVHGISIRLQDPNQAAKISDQLVEKLPPGLELITWMEQNKQLFDAIAMERHVMFFILLFIVIVAAFGIMNTLITVTVQKTREIGILKAVGAQTRQIMMIFLAQGMVVGFLGVISGVVLGVTLVHWRNQVSHLLSQLLGIEIFPKSIYQFSQIPAEIIPKDVLVISCSAFLICTIAALIPAWISSRLDPVQALRQD